MSASFDEWWSKFKTGKLKSTVHIVDFNFDELPNYHGNKYEFRDTQISVLEKMEKLKGHVFVRFNDIAIYIDDGNGDVTLAMLEAFEPMHLGGKEILDQLMVEKIAKAITVKR